MALSVGIVGLPNVGKSTLFNALLRKQQAFVANFPFATIDPNIGIVPVPDGRLNKLAGTIKKSEEMNSLPPIVPATVKFVDIAGLVAGAHEGEGLGNKFLAHIRETTVVCHVLRLFEDQNATRQGPGDPKEDFEIVETELKLADLTTLEKQKEPKGVIDKDERVRWEVVTNLRRTLEAGSPVREAELDENEEEIARTLNLLTAKPILVALNVSEDDLKRAKEIEKEYAEELDISENQAVVICAKLETELAQLPEKEQKNYLAEYAVAESGLERLIKKAYATLDLISFLTAGEKEIRAWTITKGTTAKEASGTIHSDFEQFFIKADVLPFEEFIDSGGWRTAREQGQARSEGKGYLVQDGDVIEFKIGAK
jgi:GTP-binding protein YchF